MPFSLRRWLRRRPREDPYRLERHETRHGVFYLPCLETDVIAAAIKRGEIFEEEIVRLARPLVVPGTTVLDVGANFGQMAIIFSRLVGDNGRVLAFEADDFVFDILRRNVEANHCSNVTPVFGAVYDEAGKEIGYPVPDFRSFGTFGSYGIDPTAPLGRKVRTLTIDSLALTGRVSFMKVDVQGSDLSAMRGAIETINRQRMPIIFEFEEQFQARFGTCFDDYSRFIDSINYRIADVIYRINFLIVPR